MHATWFYSTRFLVRENNVFDEGSLSYEVFRRYLRYFDVLTVVGRRLEEDNWLNMKYSSKASGPRVDFEFLPSLSRFDYFRNYRAVARRVSELVANSDVVIARLPSEHACKAIHCAARQGKPVVVELVGCAWDSLWNYGSPIAKLYAPVAFERTSRGVRKADCVNWVSKEFLPRRYPAPRARVKTSISDVQLKDEIGAAELVNLRNLGRLAAQPCLLPEYVTRRMACVEAPRTIGLIGSMKVAYKGHSTAFRALKLLSERGYNHRLRIIGAGDPAPWAERARREKILDRVEFGGNLASGRPVLDWLDDVDIYIQPSRQEGLPRALIEAMSRGCPAVGSTAGGIPELLSPECLHQPGDHARLAELVERACVDKPWRDQLIARNVLVSLDYFDSILDPRRDSFWSEVAQLARLSRAQESAKTSLAATA